MLDYFVFSNFLLLNKNNFGTNQDCLLTCKTYSDALLRPLKAFISIEW